MNLVIALSIMDTEGEYLLELFSPLQRGAGPRFRQSLYALHADFLDFRPRLADLFQLRNKERGAGFRDFLIETRDHPGFLKNHPELLRWFQESMFEEIAEFCRGLLAEADIPASGARGHIKEAILRDAKNGLLAYDDALALVYFTYQIVRPL
jgi:hypothetical protein